MIIYNVTSVARIRNNRVSRLYHVTIETQRTNAFGHLLSKQYTIEVWQYAPTLFAYHICDEWGILRTGTNGANGERYQGLGATWREATHEFRQRYLGA